MRVLFVVPPWRTTDALVNDLYPMPYAAVLLGTVLEKAGHEVVIKDFLTPAGTVAGEATAPASFAGKGSPGYTHYGWRMDSCKDWLNINLERFDAVGLMLGQCNLYETGFELGQYISSRKPLVIGGSYATTLPAEAADGTGADVVVLGEGEEVVEEALNAAINAHQQAQPHKAIMMAGSGYVDINATEIPDWALIDLRDYPKSSHGLRGVLTVSRGCPHRCTFCSVHTVHGLHQRRMGRERIFEELATLGSQGVQYYCFLDDNLFPSMEAVDDVLSAIAYAKEFKVIPKNARFYVEEGLEVRIAAQPEVITRLVDAGFINIALGLETLNMDVRKTTRKPYTTEQLYMALYNCQAAGVVPRMFYIIGLPGDTRNNVAENLIHLSQLGVQVRPNNLKLYPGTDLTSRYKYDGIIGDDYDWRLSSFWTPDTANLKYTEIKKFKTRLRAIGEAAAMGVGLFTDSLDDLRDKFLSNGYKLTAHRNGVVELVGRMFRPTPYKYMAEAICLRLGVRGCKVTIKDYGNGTKIITAIPQNAATDLVQAAMVRGVKSMEVML